jgi:tetratricopeptide (TPR) repeat protein
MTGRWLWRGTVLLLLAAVLAAGGAASSRAQHADEAEALNHEMFRIYQAGKYKEAAEVEERELALRERQAGPDDPGVGLALNNLGNIYRKLGRYIETESLWKRNLAIREKALGPEHPYVATTLNNLALLYTDLNRHAEAEPLYQRSLAIREKVLGPDSSEVGLVLNNLALLYFYEGRYREAEPLYQRSLAVREKALGPNHRDVAQTALNLGLLYKRQDRYAEAELAEIEHKQWRKRDLRYGLHPHQKRIERTLKDAGVEDRKCGADAGDRGNGEPSKGFEQCDQRVRDQELIVAADALDDLQRRRQDESGKTDERRSKLPHGEHDRSDGWSGKRFREQPKSPSFTSALPFLLGLVPQNF